MGVGSVSIRKNVARYSIVGIKDISKIITHFDNYPLQSSKQIDFALWNNCVSLMLEKKHLTNEGLYQILSYKTAINYGESSTLNLFFPNITYMKRPEIKVQDVPLNPFWVTGFMAGEGSFYISTAKNTQKMRPIASIGLNNRDKFLLIKINNFFNNIGSVYETASNNSAELKVFSPKSLDNLITHFNNYPLKGFKAYNFIIWCDLVKLLSNKESLTENMNQIKDLKDKINKWS